LSKDKAFFAFFVPLLLQLADLKMCVLFTKNNPMKGKNRAFYVACVKTCYLV
jgi:hypothetical protein